MTRRVRSAISGWSCLGLVLALGGCSAWPEWDFPSWNESSRVIAPVEGLTIQRVLGEDPLVQPIERDVRFSETVRTGLMEGPRGTLADPDAALRDIPRYEPVARPDLERQLEPIEPEPTPPPRRFRGSSALPDLPRVPEADLRVRPTPPRLVEPIPEPPAGRREGEVIIIPGEPPGVTTGGTERYRTFNQPGTGGGGIAFPDGAGTIVIPPGGTARTVPQ